MLFAQAGAPILPEPEMLDLQVATEVAPVEPQTAQPTDSFRDATLAALWFLDPGAPFESVSFEAIAALAQAEGPATDAQASTMTEAELTGLRNNVHFKESLRLKALALEAFEYGDYDASANYAAEAARAALRSDEYVAMQLKRRAAGDGIAAARSAWIGPLPSAPSSASRKLSRMLPLPTRMPSRPIPWRMGRLA
jgi:hypothetical protein